MRPHKIEHDKSKGMKVVWVETGDDEYPRIPIRVSNLKISELSSSKDFEMDTLTLLRNFLNLQLTEYQMMLLLWAFVDAGQKSASKTIFQSNEEYFDWHIMNGIGTAIRIAEITEVHEDNDEEMLEAIQRFVESGDEDNPVFQVLKAVTAELSGYFTRLYQKAQKKIRPKSHQGMQIPDHQ